MTACAQAVNAADSGLPNGPASQQSGQPTSSPAGLLVLRLPGRVSEEQMAALVAGVSPVAAALNLEPLILDGGADAHIQSDNSALLEALSLQTAALSAQTEAIHRMAASTEALILAMAEADGDDGMPPLGHTMDSPAG
ncbi:MAG: hypothetical protein V4718_04420 [Pseudomonadota bacterium]